MNKWLVIKFTKKDGGCKLSKILQVVKMEKELVKGSVREDGATDMSSYWL